MGLIFDIQSFKLYESWYRSSMGRAMDHFVESLIPEIVEPQKYERVLDVGCGAGNHLLLLNKWGLDIAGLDASPYMVDIARKRLGNRCTLKTGLAEDLPFDDNEFDLVTLINSLEFFDDPLEALREAGRVAKRKVFIMVVNAFSPQFASNKVRGLFRDTIFRYIKSYNLWELKSQIQKTYGHVPVEWRSERAWSSPLSKDPGPYPQGFGLLPFGSFLGLAALMKYTVKTDNIPLKVRIKKREETAVSGFTTTMRCRHKNHERGIPL